MTQRHARIARILLALAAIAACLVGAIGGAPSVSASPATDQAVVITRPNCAQPPAHADLTTFTDTQLAKYGLPPKPANQAAIAGWQNILKHAKHRLCNYVRRSRPHQTDVSHEWDTGNYAGNMGTAGGYSYITATWTLPCLNIGNSQQNAMSSEWVGLGGYPNSSAGQIIQSGSEGDMVGTSSATYFLWTENFANGHDTGTMTPQGFTPRCGSDVITAVDRNDFDGGDEAYEFVEDVTQSYYFDTEQYGSSWTYKSSISADWIVERPSPNGSPLADFHQVTFTGTGTTQSGNYVNVGQTPHVAVVMCTDAIGGYCGWGSTKLAHPGSIVNGGSDFPVYWDHA